MSFVFTPSEEVLAPVRAKLVQNGWEFLVQEVASNRIRATSIRGEVEARGMHVAEHVHVTGLSGRALLCMSMLVYRRPIDDWKPTTRDHARWNEVIERCLSPSTDAGVAVYVHSIVETITLIGPEDMWNVMTCIRTASEKWP